MFLPLLQQGCDLRWETASARLGFAQALAVKCGLSSMSQLWHGIEFLKELNQLEETLSNSHKTNVGEERKRQLLRCETNP